MLKKIVILGGGFAGLRAIREVARGLRYLKLTDRYELTLVDRNTYHTFTPLLYEIATTTEAADACATLQSIAAFPLAELVPPSVRCVHAEVTDIHLPARSVRLRGEEIHFDYLIFALGSEPSFFGTPGVAQNALTLKSVSDAVRIRDAVVALWETDAADIDIAVVGAGPTGVELAGELRTWTDELRSGDPQAPEVHLRLIERAPTILSGFDPHVAAAAAERLRRLGVEVRVGIALESALGGTATLSTGEVIPADLLIWTAGVQASHRGESLPFPRDAEGRIAVTTALRGAGGEGPFAERIYVVGDAAGFRDREGHLAPQTAPIAVAEGTEAARNLLVDIARDENVERPQKYTSFRLRAYPYIVPVGGKYAITKLGPLLLRGRTAWFFKGIVELHYICSILPLHRALAVWLRGLRVFLASKRLG